MKPGLQETVRLGGDIGADRVAFQRVSLREGKGPMLDKIDEGGWFARNKIGRYRIQDGPHRTRRGFCA
jgi:hypothetical protein